MKKKSIKITFFNPITFKKRVYRFVVEWNNFNHCWNITLTTEGLYTETREMCNHLAVRWDYNIFINHWIKSEQRRDEYITIKTVQ